MSKKTVRVLVLEDAEERLKKFRAFFAVHNDYVFEVDYTKDVDQALAWFDEKQYDIMCLDHDLAEAHYAGVATTAKTGYDFVKALAGRPNCKKVVLSVVHSVNPIGNGQMMGVLRDNGMTNWSKPFVWDSTSKMQQLVTLFSHCSKAHARKESGDKRLSAGGYPMDDPQFVVYATDRIESTNEMAQRAIDYISGKKG